MTCVVHELGDATVVWKKWESGKSGPKILTAGETRVTSDERMRIIHDQGKKNFLFLLTRLNENDDCFISFFKVQVFI